MASLSLSPLILGFSILSLFLASSPLLVHSLTCTSQKLTNNNVYTHCLDLPTLTSYLHYTYDSSNRSLSIAFLAAPPAADGWVAWAINPTDTGMAGAQSLVAFKESGKMTLKLFNISGYSSVEATTKLLFDVWDTSAEESGGFMRIYGKIKVPEDLAAAGKVNQIWQVGPSVSKDVLTKHDFAAANLASKATLDLSGAQTDLTPTGTDSRLQRRNIHGILNAVSWGVLFPLGVVIARYMRVFGSMDPAWFYLHVSCQLSAYAIGTAGWATGLKLGSESKGITYSSHRNIGIALFALATLQMFALFLRPKKDHKYRFYWNIYHHGVGFSIVIMGIVNVFKGLDILVPDKKWRTAYVTVLCVLAGIALLLEAFTWIVVLKRKSRSTKS